MSDGPTGEAVTHSAAPHSGLARAVATTGRGVRRVGQAFRESWAATSLRIRLIVALLLLVAIGLGVTGTVGVNLLRNYLVQQVDARIEQGAHARRLPAFPGGNSDLPSSVVYRLYDSNGNQIQAFGAPLGGQQVPTLQGITPDAAQKRGETPFTVSGPNGGRWRTVLVPAVDNGTGAPITVAVMASLSDVDHTINRLVLFDLLVGLLTLLALGMVAVVLVRLTLRPLTGIENTAEAIGAGDLSRRVPDADPRTEVGRLSQSLNAMLSQIESSARARERSEQEARASEEQMRQFVADAGHELRTPLTSIRGFAELYGQQVARAGGDALPEPAETRRMMSRIETEATRMSGLVEDLLLLARLDQQRPLDRQPVDLVPLVADAAFDAHTLAPDRAVRLALPGGPEQAGVNGEAPAVDAMPGAAPAPPQAAGDATDGASNPVVVDGDEARLRQILANLVANALTHTPEGTPVDLGLWTERRDGHDWAVLAVRDEGPGLTEDQATRVFQRFYRADPGRSRNRGGVGLGLSIVAALAQAHGGAVEVDSRPGAGSTFRVLLPLVAPGTPTRPPMPAPAPAPS